MNNKKKLAMVQATDYISWPLGGTLTYMLNILPYFESRYSIELWGVEIEGITKKKSIKINNRDYEIHYFGKFRTKNRLVPNIIIEMIGAFRNAKQINKSDIIFYHSAESLLFANARVCLGRNKKPFYAYIQHGLNYMQWPISLRKLCAIVLSPRAEKRSDINFLVTDKSTFKEYMNRYVKKNKEKYIQVGSPIDYEKLQNHTRKESDYPRIVLCGRLAEDKRPLLAIDIFSRFLRKYNDNARLDIVGDGVLMEECKKRVRESKYSSNIRLLGALPREEVINVLYENDLAIHTSVAEGMSLTLLEDLACGLPVVAFEVPGVINLIENQINGILVKDGDEEAFSRAIVEGIQRRDFFSSNARITAKEYDREKIADYLACIIDIFYEGKQ